ncbi:MAG: HlyD family efflux transporter periplasmic adaptor subunit [Planctomycetota bacterium]
MPMLLGTASLVLLLVVGALAVTGNGVMGGGEVTNPASVYSAEVKRGPLVISVTQTGTIKAASQAVVKSEIEGMATILELVPEGEKVTAGDLLISLDTSKLQDDRVTAEIKVRNDESDLLQANEELAVKENQAIADVSAAELDLRFAIEDHKKYMEGDFPKELKQAQNKIVIADAELKRSQEKRRGSERLYEAGFISFSELEADRLSEQKNQLDLELARQAADLLEGWTYRRKIDEFESDIEQKTMALERARRKATADVAQANARVSARQAELRREQLRLDNIVRQIGAGNIYAPTDGMVVYATSSQGGWRGNQEPLEPGQSVRERQELIYLPDDVDRIAEVSIHESQLDKIRVGQKARITLDAVPGAVFWGEVETIAPLPDATAVFWNPDNKIYPTKIRIRGKDLGLRTGMSCRVEIIVERLDDAVYVPVQSVVRVGGTESVFVVNDDGSIERRDVETGLDDNANVVIKNGVDAGEKVSLTPPLENTQIDDGVGVDDLVEGAGEPSTRPAEEAESTDSYKPVTVASPREAFQILLQRASPEERERYQKHINEQNWTALRSYGTFLAKKYNVTIESSGEGRPSTRPAAEQAPSSEASDAE